MLVPDEGTQCFECGEKIEDFVIHSLDCTYCGSDRHPGCCCNRRI